MRDSQNTAQTLTESLKYFLKYRDQTVVMAADLRLENYLKNMSKKANLFKVCA